MIATNSIPSDADSATHVQQPAHEQIAALAFSIHLQHGSQHGRDEEDWLEAERMLLRPEAAAHSTASGRHDQWAPRISTPLIEHFHARDERHSPSRGEIRQMNTSHRPAARSESQRSSD